MAYDFNAWNRSPAGTQDNFLVDTYKKLTGMDAPATIKPTNKPSNAWERGTIDKNKVRVTQIANMPQDMENYKARLEDVANLPSMLQQQQGIDSLQELAKLNVGTAPQLDLSPLMALTDQWSGSKLASQYKRPESLQEQQQKGFGYLSDIQKRREELSDKQRQLAKDSMTNGGVQQTEIIRDQTDADKEALRPATGKTKTESDVLAGIQKIFNKDPLVVKGNERLLAAINAKKLATSGNKIAPGAIKTVIPRLLGEVGNLAQQEQERVGGSQALIDRLNRLYSTATSGQITDTDMKEFVDLVDIFEQSARNSINERADLHSAQGQAAHGIPMQKIRDSFALNQMQPPAAKPHGQNKTKIVKTGLTPQQEARRQELLKKAGK